MQTKWQEKNNKLVAEFEFADFSEALAFANRVGEIAESINHHPDIAIHDYKNVRIETTSHDAGETITEKDYQLADAIDKIS